MLSIYPNTCLKESFQPIMSRRLVTRTSDELQKFLSTFEIPYSQTSKGKQKLKQEMDDDEESTMTKPHYISMDPSRSLRVESRQMVEKFWIDYSKLPHPKSISEYQGYAYTSVAVDVDWFSPNQQSQSEIDAHVLTIIQSAKTILSKSITINIPRSSHKSNNHLDFLVFANKPPKFDEDKQQWKVGYHLQLPKIMLDQTDRVKFATALNAIHPEVDTAVAKSPWLLYGSSKNSKGNPYKLSYIIDYSGKRSNDYLKWLSQLWGLKITEQTLPRFLSLFPYRESLVVNDSLAWPEYTSEWIPDPDEESLMDSHSQNHSNDDIMPLDEPRESSILGHLRSLNVADQFRIDNVQNEAGFCQLERIKPGKCPIDGCNSHTSLGGWIRVLETETHIGCFSKSCSGKCKIIRKRLNMIGC